LHKVKNFITLFEYHIFESFPENKKLSIKNIFQILTFPFAAIVAQDELKKILLLLATDPRIGGALLMGERGTGKSTIVRALQQVIPSENRTPIPIIDLPLGATEDRITGSINVSHALAKGEIIFEEGLLAKADGGFIYIDEVNLLEDHLIDLLLDVATSGENIVEREGLSYRHKARFGLIGSGNPEEGELRPQLLDRFGLYCIVSSEQDNKNRVELIKRRLEFDNDPIGFTKKWNKANKAIEKQIKLAKKLLSKVILPDLIIEKIATICSELEVHGHRAEIVITRSAKVNAALEQRLEVTNNDVLEVAKPALLHRLKKDPLETMGEATRIEIVLRKYL